MKEEALNWARQHPRYSKYIQNEEIALRMYRKFVLGEKTSGVVDIRYPRIEIRDLTDGKRCSVQGIVLEKRIYSYRGCPVCKKKMDEECSKHKMLPEPLSLVYLLVADNSSSVWCICSDNGAKNVEEGDEVIVYGRGKKYRDNLEMTIDKLEQVLSNQDNIEQLLGFVRKSGGMKKQLVLGLCKRFNVEWEAISDKVVVDENEIVRVKQ